MKEDVIVIVGPTAVGKTALGIALAKQLNTEIISGDSVQVYKGLDIGSGKVTEEEAEGVHHYMIDIVEPTTSFSVADFQKKVRETIQVIHAKGMIPIIVGGSGLYIQAILYEYEFTENQRNETITKELEKFVEENGREALYARLQEVDPAQAEKIHPNNIRRVIRALEYYYDTGNKLSHKEIAEEKESLYHHHIIGLEMERNHLYGQINKRVDEMVEHGLIEEVTSLYKQYGKNVRALRAIGYKEIIDYIDGKVSKEDAIAQLKQNSRRFAKRQFTWFKNKMNVHWYMMEENGQESVYNQVQQDLHKVFQI